MKSRRACESSAVETSRNVPSAIVGTADEHDAAIIVTGTRGRSRVAATMLGSSAEGILRHAGRPVLLVPPAPHTEIAVMERCHRLSQARSGH